MHSTAHPDAAWRKGLAAAEIVAALACGKILIAGDP